MGNLPGWLLPAELPTGTPRTVRLMPADIEAEVSARKAASARQRWAKDPSRTEFGRRISEGKRRAALLREVARIDQKRQERT